jgi:hypothetical protein
MPEEAGPEDATPEDAGPALDAGRGSYPWATRLTQDISRVRERVAAFVGEAAAPDGR